MSSAPVKQAIREARDIIRMVQGTMSLEGQGLTNRATLRVLQKLATRRLLANRADAPHGVRDAEPDAGQAIRDGHPSEVPKVPPTGGQRPIVGGLIDGAGIPSTSPSQRDYYVAPAGAVPAGGQSKIPGGIIGSVGVPATSATQRDGGCPDGQPRPPLLGRIRRYHASTERYDAPAFLVITLSALAASTAHLLGYNFVVAYFVTMLAGCLVGAWVMMPRR